MREYKELKVNGNRQEIRHQLINEFLLEKPGTGTGEDCSIYIYYVESLTDGSRIFLKRPARLNKGFDFEVNVENTYFGYTRKTTMPSHNIIYEDLEWKKEADPKTFTQVKKLITKLYNCDELSNAELNAYQFTVGYSIETILKSIKWLFIEQDVTYWNWSGRNMLYSSLNEL
jgi:hypothetical protein